MQNHIDKLEAIYQIDETILTILDIDKLLKKVLHILEETFGFESAAVLLYDEKSEALYIRAATGYMHDSIQTFRTTIGGRGTARSFSIIPNATN